MAEKMGLAYDSAPTTDPVEVTTVNTESNTLTLINRLATIIIVLAVVVAGAVVTITNPATLSFESYIHDVAIGAGLLGIGYGIDSKSRP